MIPARAACGGARGVPRCPRHDGDAMKHAWIVLFASVCALAGAVAPGRSAPERFSADKPTPLKRLKADKDDTEVRFAGSVRLAGQFLVVWQRIDRKPVYRQVLFFPDQVSAALLPHAAASGPVTELLFANREQAGAMLLDLPTVQTALAGDRIGSEGAASVTIRDYRAVVDCDHRWYRAQLVAVKKNRNVIVAARDAPPGC